MPIAKLIFLLPTLLFAGCGPVPTDQMDASKAHTFQDSDLHLRAAIAAYKRKHYDEALLAFEHQALRGNSSAGYWAGKIHYETYERERSKDNLREAVTHFLASANQGHIDAMLALADNARREVSAQLKDFDESIHDAADWYERILKLEPNNRYATYGLGQIRNSTELMAAAARSGQLYRFYGIPT